MSEQFDGDVRQRRVIKALEERNLKLAGLYRTALRNLESPADEGCEAARVSIICHCMRELMNGLPGLLADSAIPRPKPSSGSLMAKLPELLSDHPDVDLGSDQDIVPVPKAVAQALDSLISAVVKERGRNRSNAAALVTGGDDTRHPAIRQWMDAYEFFLGWAHLDRNDDDRELPGDGELVTVMRVVEDVVEVRTKAFFENLHSLEGLLAEINTPIEDGV